MPMAPDFGIAVAFLDSFPHKGDSDNGKKGEEIGVQISIMPRAARLSSYLCRLACYYLPPLSAAICYFFAIMAINLASYPLYVNPPSVATCPAMISLFQARLPSFRTLS